MAAAWLACGHRRPSSCQRAFRGQLAPTRVGLDWIELDLGSGELNLKEGSLDEFTGTYAY